MTATDSDISWWSVIAGALKRPLRPSAMWRGLWWLLRLRPDTPWSIGALLEDRARRWPQQAALRFHDQQWTLAEFNAWVNRIAHVLQQQGIGPGDVVGLLMENRPEVLACAAASVKLGAIAGMLNHHQRGEVQAHSVAAMSPKLFIVDEPGLDALRSAGPLPGTRACLTVMPTRPAGPASSPAPDGLTLQALTTLAHQAPDHNPATTTQVQLRQPCFYILTSGTSGLPKASVMTHFRWMRAAAGIGNLSARLGRDDVLYVPLPLHHNNGLTVGWGAALSTGATLALSRRFSARHFWTEASQMGATAFCYVGEICRYLLDQPASPEHDRRHAVRTILGNGLRADLWAPFLARFGIERVAEFYAASECNLVFVNAFNLVGTAGFCPLPYAIIEVDTDTCLPLRDAAGLARRVPAGGTGLLISEINERMPFDGYSDKRANEAKLLRNVFEPGDQWFSSGDLVRDQGMRHIQFVDRLGDTFRWKGENVATTEVERALDACPQIQESVVYGVTVPGCEGRAGMAAVRLASAPDGQMPTLDGLALARHLRASLPAYAVPQFLRLRTQQAVTHTFKHVKGDLKTQGFDLTQVRDPLLVLSPHHEGYVPLTPELARQIQDRQWRW